MKGGMKWGRKEERERKGFTTQLQVKRVIIRLTLFERERELENGRNCDATWFGWEKEWRKRKKGKEREKRVKFKVRRKYDEGGRGFWKRLKALSSWILFFRVPFSLFENKSGECPHLYSLPSLHNILFAFEESSILSLSSFTKSRSVLRGLRGEKGSFRVSERRRETWWWWLDSFPITSIHFLSKEAKFRLQASFHNC